jgi:hypothetical protein
MFMSTTAAAFWRGRKVLCSSMTTGALLAALINFTMGQQIAGDDKRLVSSC